MCRDGPSLEHLLNWSHCTGTAIFFWASWHQYKCHVILAKLRTPSDSQHSGVKAYKIPHGDWFKFVSSPHYFAEILIYTSFNIIQGGRNSYIWLMLVFVVLNLCLGATVTQHWYQHKFDDYPTSRHRIIPFVY